MENKNKMRQLVLNKSGQRFVFRYEEGRDAELLEAIKEQAESKRTDFDWFDAAVLSFKLTQTLISRADELLVGMN